MIFFSSPSTGLQRPLALSSPAHSPHPRRRPPLLCQKRNQSQPPFFSSPLKPPLPLSSREQETAPSLSKPNRGSPTPFPLICSSRRSLPWNTKTINNPAPSSLRLSSSVSSSQRRRLQLLPQRWQQQQHRPQARSSSPSPSGGACRSSLFSSTTTTEHQQQRRPSSLSRPTQKEGADYRSKVEEN